MGSRSRRKGLRFERLIAESLRDLGLTTRRGGQSWRADPLGYAGIEPDIVVDEKVSWWIECKTGAQPSVWRAMDQACADAGDGQTPIVIAHRDRGRTLVCMELHDWLEWVREQIEEE